MSKFKKEHDSYQNHENNNNSKSSSLLLYFIQTLH